MITNFSEMNVDGFNDAFERAAFNRQRAEVLSSAFLYDEDEEARAKVDADDFGAVFAAPNMRADESLHVLGRELALTVDTDLADMPMDLAQRAIDRVEDEGRRNGYRERFNQLGAAGGDTAQDYYRLYAQVQRDNVQIPYREHVAKVEERKAGLTGLFAELVAAGGFKAPEAWAKFDSGFDRGVYTAEDKESIDKAADAWSMMRGMAGEYADASANVLAQGSTGELIFNRLYGDELASALFFAQLQKHVQDMKTSAEERNFFVRLAQAFEAADKTLMAGMLGGHFKAFVTDEQVDDYNRELERAREISGLENPNVPFYAEGDNWAEKHLGLHNARLGAVHSAARQSGQLNEDGSLRKMTAEERRSTQELNEFRGQLFNATEGLYDVDGFAAKFGKMLPNSLIYLVPGGMVASGASMYTTELAQGLGNGESWTVAGNKAVVNSAIQATVEKIAFGSLKAGRMVPGLDWLMSRQFMARSLGRFYGTTAGRMTMGMGLGITEETFAEPLAALLLGGVYNAVASEELDLNDPWGAYKQEMEEMLSPDQFMATALYSLLLMGASYQGQKQAALNYEKTRDRLMAIGVDEGRAAQVARIESQRERMVAAQKLIDERLKTDSKGVLAYVAELYPQLQPMATVENYFDKGLLPRILPAGDGQVKVQEKDENGEVTETLMSEATARLLVESRLEELSGKEQAEMADMVLANAMVGSLSKDGGRWVVSLESDKMNHAYFQRLARAAGLKLSEGARPEDIDPEVHPHIPLGQVAQQGQAWEARMKVARHDYEQKLGHPVSDEEWERVSKTYGSRVNRTGVRGADKRLRTVLRVARGKFGAMEVLEDVTEDNLVRDMVENGRTLDYYITNLRELEGALGKPGAFLRELKEGETEGDRRMAVIEAMGKLVQSKVLADTARSGNKLSAALNAFLELIRSWVLQAKAMFKLGEAVNTVLTNPEAAAKMDKEFREDVERLVAQDVEFLQGLQLADGLEAMQRVYEAQDAAKADRKVKRRKRAKSPVVDEAMEKHGEEVRKEQAEKEQVQAEVQADVEAAEAAVDGDFTSSVVNEEEPFRARTGSEKFAPDAKGKEPVLSVNVHAMLENGSKATKNDLIADESGNVFWGRLPELDELKNKGYGALDIILRLGGKSDGFNHIVHKHGQWIMDAMGIDEPILACKRFIAEVLQSVKKINYITNGKRASLIAKSGEASRYFIVAIGKDAAEPKYAGIKTAFVASTADRYDSDIAIYEGKDALELRIPMSSFGENQRFRGASERQDRSSDYPVAAASSPSKGMMPEVGNVVKHEELISYKNNRNVGDFSASVDELVRAAGREPQKVEGVDMSFCVVGPLAANWDKIKHRAFRGRDDGKLRVELDASAAKLKVGKDGSLPTKGTVGDFLHFPELFEAYPPIATMPMAIKELENNALGAVTREGIVIVPSVAKDHELVMSILLHEIQHVIQHIEGYAQGGNPSSATRLRDRVLAGREKYEERQGDLAFLNRLPEIQVRYEWLINKCESELQVLSALYNFGEGYEEAKKLRAELEAYAEGINKLLGEDEKHSDNLYGTIQCLRIDSDIFYMGSTQTLDYLRESYEMVFNSDRLNELKEYRKKTEAELGAEDAQNMRALENLGQSDDAYVLYRHLAGEIEARNVQTRMGWTAEEREAKPFNETLEYPGEALVSFSADYPAPWAESVDASFNVVGPSAANWDKIKHRAFKGRDDGKERVEIDASGAKLKSEALRGKNLKAYRQIIADWNELPEAERKEVEAYAELCAERDEAANKLNETTENDFQEAYAVANKLTDEANSKRVKVREIIGEFFKMKGADGSVGITAKNEIIDAMAVDFWCEWGSDKVENSLASDPMAMGMSLSDVLDYPELYEAYPQLEWLHIHTADLKGYNGMVRNNGWSDYITMNRSLLDNWEQFRSTLLHEVQHVIQRIEGFAKGGNTESVRRKVKELLEGTGARIDMLERDLRWFSAVNIARDLLKEARSLRRYPNAWKRSGRRFEFARMSDSAEEIREKILRDIAERYNEFRREDTSETLLLDMPDLLLPEVHFHSVDSIEAGLAALDKLKSRKLVFRGTAAKKNRRLKELQKHHDAMQKVLSEFECEPYELYLRLAGEIESRNVQERRNWTEAERAARPFNETLEYPGEALVSFSVIGPKAETFDQYADRMFRGRDDGLPRAEIDASKAELKMKLKPEAERTNNVRALHDKLRVYANGLDEYEKFKPVQRLWLLLQSRLTKGMRLSESEDWQRLKGFVCGDVEPVEYLGQIGLSEESSIDDIKAAYLKAESDLHETLSEFVAEENVSEDVFNAAFKVLLGGGNMALTPDDWEGKGETLGDILDYEELYAAYPEMRDIRMEYRSGGSSARASDTGLADAKIILGVNKTPEKLRGSLLHEIQHLIQLHEDFAFGGTPSNVGRIFGRLGRDAELTDRGDHDYKRLSGEIEARAVSRRQYMSEAERSRMPFNEAMEYPGEALTFRPSEFYATFDTTFSVSPTLGEDIARARKRAKNADGTISQDGEMSRNAEVELCTMPDFMRFLGEPNVPVVARVFTLRKLLTDHKLTDELTYEVVEKMNDPVLAIQETPSTYLVLIDSEVENKDGSLAPVVCAVEHKKGKDGIRYLVSAYSLDNDKETKITQQFKKLVYCKYNETAKFTADAPQVRAYDLLRAAISGGHTQNVPCQEDVVKWKQQKQQKSDFTSSVVNLDERALAYEVVAAGQGFRANLAFSEQIVREMRGALLRMKKLGSKTRTEREDAIAAMGTMVQVVKAAVAYLPQGYRFSVHPYLNKLEVLAELATTGDLKMTKDLANKTIKEWLKLNQGIGEVVAVKGQELNRQTSAAELAKEYGEMQLQEAMETIMHRVAGQLRKHAKDRAILKIKELVERLAPKKDPKTGKLKGGKMSADAYRDLADVATAMGMDAEELEAKLAALRAELEKPGLDEDRRAQLESEMTLYDQFGNLKDMTAEEAVEALEALRQRVWFHRFEWDNVQAERRAARRAMVRSVVEGVGAVSENEYNAKKRAVKPTKRLKHLGDILSGMPAVLTGLRGYLPLHKLADNLALRANRAGEAIKKWEAERWVALEALSRDTLGKSWRKCMDFMHEVLPTGVTFDRPKYRSVSVKTAALRELLAMTKEERRAEMNRRRDAGGLEAESVLTERDVEELSKALSAMEEEDKVLSTVEARYVASVQREENLKLSRGEALYAILMYEQPRYTERMEAQGYTPEVIVGLKRFIGEGMLQFGYGLRELFALQGERIARVYEATFGVPFPREENYFAARWNVTGMKENSAEQLLAGMAGTPGAANGWMKQRVDHSLELDMTKDALQVFLQATTLTDTWMATQDIVADFKAWTRDPDFDRAMVAALGKEGYENLKDWIRIVEQGGVQDCLNMGVSQDVINGLYGSGAVAILGFRIQTWLRQLPSIFNGLLGAHDISVGEWLATLSRMRNAEAPMTYKRMLKSTLIQNRMQGKAGNMAGQAMRSNDTASSMTEGVLLWSMLPMEIIDASCTAMSLVPVWNVYYQRAIDKGASVQEAEQAAWEQTTIVANLSAQPIGWLNKSKIAQSRNPLVKAVFFMLSENTAKFAMCRALWRGGKKKAAFRAWLLYGAANAVISALLDALQGDPEEFEKGKWWEYVLSALYGPLASIPGVGEMVEALGTLVLNATGHALDVEELKKARTHASVGRAMLDAQGFIKAWTKIYGYMTDDEEHSLAEYTRAASTISRSMAIGTGWMSNALGYWSTVAAVLMNPIDFGARVWRNWKHYFD